MWATIREIRTETVADNRRRSESRSAGRFGRAAWLVLGVTALTVVGAVGIRKLARRPGDDSASKLAIRGEFERGLDSLVQALDQLDRALARTDSATPAFRHTRVEYKRIETLLETFGPAVVEALNGPGPEPDDDKPYLPLGAPAGFQVIEGSLFGRTNVGQDSLHATVRAMLRATVALRGLTGRVQIKESDLLEALRLEIARVATLGLAGFDAP